MSRREGFSLVEMLIVLAVMAALISTITPVALNAVRKAKAAQVAQNLKAIATGIENKAYIDGQFGDLTNGLSSVGRDVPEEYLTYVVDGGSGTYEVWVVCENTEVDFNTVKNMLSGVGKATSSPLLTIPGTSSKSFKLTNDHKEDSLSSGDYTVTEGSIYYNYAFAIY